MQTVYLAINSCPFHMSWNGSIRFGSQATVEWAFMEIGHKVQSKKAPFANIATLLFERANGKALTLYDPCLSIPTKEKKVRAHLYQSLPVKKTRAGRSLRIL